MTKSERLGVGRHVRLIPFVLALIVAIVLLLKYEAAILFFGSTKAFVRGLIRPAFLIIKSAFLRVMRKLFSKRIVKTLLAVLGLSGVMNHFSGRYKKRIKPRVVEMCKKGKERWMGVPSVLRILLGVVIFITIFSLGFGLWLLPIGASIYTRLAYKLQVIFADTAIKRVYQKARSRWRNFLRKSYGYWGVRHLRNLRCRLIRRDRKILRGIDKRLEERRKEALEGV